MFKIDRSTSAFIRTAALKLWLAGVVLVAIPLAAHAGANPQTRDGWFIGFGVGGGSAGVSSNGSSSDRTGGVAGSFRAGYTFSPRVGVGVETNAWSKEENGVTLTFSTGAATFFFYPGEGAVLRAGVGGGNADASAKFGGVTVSGSESGFAFTVGGQYEFRVTRRFALGPQVDYSWMTLDSFDANYVSGGISFNWYFIPK